MSVVVEPPQAIQSKPPLFRQKKVLHLLAIALLAELAYAVLNISAMPVYLKNDRGFGEGVIGFIVATFLLSEAVLKGPMGSLADRFGRKRLMVLGPVLTVFTALGSLFVPHDFGVMETVLFFFLRVLDGLAVAMLWPAAFALIGESVQPNEKQEAMSLLNMCYLAGVALALFVGGAADDLFGRYTRDTTGAHAPSLYLAALLCVTVSLLAYRWLPSGRAMREAARKVREETIDTKEEIVELAKTATHIPGLLLLGGVTFMGVGFPLAVFKLFAQDEFGMSGSKFGGLLLPVLIAMALFSPFMSKFGERIGRHRAVHVGLALCAVGMTVIAMGAFSPAFRNLWVLGLGAIPVGLGFLLTIPAWYASVSELDEARRAANIGAVMTAQGLGAIIGSLLGSQSYQRVQALDVLFGQPLTPAAAQTLAHYSPFIGCAVCVVFGWVLSLLLLRS
jgi:DHA1 family multidrug resistance protein-like MFS transporter